MAKRVQINGGGTTAANAFTGFSRELYCDTGANELRVHDGSTAGGFRITNLTFNDARYQALSTLLTNVAAVATAGLLTLTGSNNAVVRTLTGTANQINIANGAGTAGNPTFTLSSTITFPGTIAVVGAVALSPANANVVLAPTGTGVVTINPATAGTMDNVALGNTTPGVVNATYIKLTSGVVNSGANTLQLGVNTGTPIAQIFSLGPDVSTKGSFSFQGRHSDGTGGVAYLTSDNAGNWTTSGTFTTGGALTVPSGGAAITGNSTVAGTLGVSGVATFGTGNTGQQIANISGGNTGAADGGVLRILNNGSTVNYFGNYSAVLGGGYNADMILRGTTGNTWIYDGGFVAKFVGVASSSNYSIFTNSNGGNPSVSASGANLLFGSGSAIATNATAGMIAMPGCAGVPSGAPTGAGLGAVVLVYDTTDEKLYRHNGTNWKSVTFA